MAKTLEELGYRENKFCRGSNGIVRQFDSIKPLGDDCILFTERTFFDGTHYTSVRKVDSGGEQELSFDELIACVPVIESIITPQKLVLFVDKDFSDDGVTSFEHRCPVCDEPVYTDHQFWSAPIDLKDRSGKFENICPHCGTHLVDDAKEEIEK